MPRPRYSQVSVDTTPYYHIICRCVRRGYLCGYDSVTKQDYSHRQSWLEERIRLIASLFAIDIAGYAILSNHYHLVVRLAPQQAEHWDDHDVANRWTQIYKGTELLRRWLNKQPMSAAEEQSVQETIQEYRRRLQDLGWFMKTINEPLARQANREDEYRGHFFEARYTSQALVSEQALLACMAYVDLNPVRAGIAQTPEASRYTSIRERIHPRFNLSKAIQEQIRSGYLQNFSIQLKPLLTFEANASGQSMNGLPIAFRDYLELVDWTGRIVRGDKPGAIDDRFPSILNRLEMNPKDWLTSATQFEKTFSQRFRSDRPAAISGSG